MLKKQTIWLMTMFSLIAVLSVYYLTTPQSKMVNQNKSSDKTEVKDQAETDFVLGEENNSDPVFAQLRLQMTESRSREKERLQEVIATADVSEEEKSKAYTEMQALTDVAATEGVLETLIKSEGYNDVLVRINDDSVNVSVKAEEHSAKEANNIIRVVTKELDNFKPVAVEFIEEGVSNSK